MKLFKAVGDRMLDRLLRTTRVGACVPDHGEFCYCKSTYRWEVSCNGPCYNTLSHVGC